MAWGDLSSNQMVSFTDAQTSGFLLKSGQSHVTSNQCMTKSDITTKYNVSVSGYSSNQLVPKSLWVSSGFSATMTVGVNQNMTIFGYTLNYIGSMTSTSIDSVVGYGTYIEALTHAYNYLIFKVVTNSPSAPAPAGWTTLTINGTVYQRTSMELVNLTSTSWQWVLNTSYNPFGTSSGATKTITLI